jgi:tripartite ATP-independent transporter DctP family solute receptor
MTGLTRRTVIGSGAAALAAAALPRRVEAAEFSLKLGHTTPVAHPFHVRMQEAAANIAKASNGRIELQVFPNGELGGDNDLISQTRSGAIDFCQPTGQILASLLPVTAINAIGFAFPDYSKVWPTIDGELGKYVRAQITAKVGLVPMERIWNLGFRQITTSNKPIKTVADLEGLKIRTPIAPSLVSLFQALKASPVGMQFGEVYSALQTKVVDGQENPLSLIQAAKFYEVQKYCSITNHVWDGHWICANAASWKRLPPDMQEVVAKSFNDAALKQRQDVIKLDQSVQDDLASKGLNFNVADTESFRQRLRVAGFYNEWKQKLGQEAWGLLEAQVGKLG